jgi:hypothetical protein
MCTVKSAIGFNGFGNHRFDCYRLRHISLDEGGFPPVFCDHMDGLSSTLLVHIRNNQFGPFSSKGQRSGSSDP